MSLLFLLFMAAALAIAAGWRYQLAAPVFFVGYTYLFLLEKAHYLNHAYLFCWVAFVMCWLPAQRAFSADVLRRPALRRAHIPYWCLFVLQLLMAIVYIFGGIAKLNGDWLRGVPLNIWLSGKGDTPLLGPLLEQEWMPYFMSYGGVLLDLFVVPLLLFRRTRPWAFGFVLFFHAMNHLVFNIGIFPFLSIALTLLFFPPDFPRRALGWLERRLPITGAARRWWERKLAAAEATTAPPLPLWQETARLYRVVLAGLLLLAALHMLLPLRHHLFPGDVAWTEEGHRYAWRMMLRTKRGNGAFTVRHADGRTETIDPGRELRPRQERKLYTHPDMILQYAHHLRDRYGQRGEAVQVFADIHVRLNGRPARRFIDPEADLATIEWRFFQHSPWIEEQ